MDIRSLRYFVETVRLNSFTQAAETLHVTQSTVSKMVHNLEHEAGGQLLVRDGRNLVLTDTGRVMYARGQAILASLSDLKREISDTQYLRAGSLTVGMPPMINLLFTPVLKAFREKYPEVALTLREEPGLAIERLVAAGDLEVGITIMPCDPGLDFIAIEVARYPMWALAKAGTFLDNRTAIKLEQLRDMQLVLLNDDFASSNLLNRKFQEAGFTPKIAAQTGHWDWLVEMASAGIGVAILPELLINRLTGKKLQMVRIVEPEIQWKIAQIWNSRYLSCAARAWLEVCQSVFSGVDAEWPALCEPPGRTLPVL
ncbi:LysR family transcriptional regulator [Oxalobacteraceae bacterium CAVE-383]|nr:LysR family transcriptional regulator [Oxalobacteraceae bacterium CAVE-383]